MPAVTLHATCLVLGERGVLIRGPSGAGKSRLARRLLAGAAAAGRFGRLVADDRVRVENRNGRLVASAVPRTAGLLEVRGLGILTMAHEPSAVVRLVVDTTGAPAPRVPDAAVAVIRGVRLARLASDPSSDTAEMLLWRLDAVFSDILMTSA